ncbi:MAG: replication initiation protein [Gammaproteobacteria bacterium]
MGLTVTDMGLEKKSTGHELKKHAATIHCSNTLSLLQRKISNALLYHAYKELMQKEEHEITVKDLCKLIGYHGNNHSVIKDALKGLLSTVIEWNVVNDTTGAEDWTASSILASVSLKGPICLYAYSPRMKLLLHSPTMFGKINLFIQSRFKSSYGLALYENCIRYRGLGYTKWLEMDMFRKLMGVPADKYPIFRDFKRRVLDKSVEEVNTYSDMIVEPEVIREGRQVVKVRFSLKERAKKVRLGGKSPGDEMEDPMTDSNDELAADLIRHYGLSHDQAKQVIKDYPRDYISEKMALIESSNNFQQGKVLNLAGYFLSALKNNYQPAKNSLDKVIEKKREDREQENDFKKLETASKKIRKAYVQYREEIIDQVIKNLTPDEYTFFIQDFRDYSADVIRTILKLQRNKYTATNVLESPQLQVLLRQFALQMLPDLADKIMPFENYVATLPEKTQSVWHEFTALLPHHELLKLTEV